MVHYYSFRQKRVLSSHYGSGCVVHFTPGGTALHCMTWGRRGEENNSYHGTSNTGETKME